MINTGSQALSKKTPCYWGSNRHERCGIRINTSASWGVGGGREKGSGDVMTWLLSYIARDSWMIPIYGSCTYSSILLRVDVEKNCSRSGLAVPYSFYI